MVQMNSIIKITDNSGAKTALWITPAISKNQHKISTLCNYNQISIVSVRFYARISNGLLIKKGSLFNALIVRQKINLSRFNGSFIKFYNNSAILFDPKKENTPLGTRIFGGINKELRLKKYLKVISLASCII